ncbi:MAG TPA: TetR/AcrR family transcriptional regulator [Allosphingosinicella sp.]|jgi:AcrR family transcriptional regulator
MARDRRSEILDVAGEIFLEQGYAAASMSAIAARLGGSKGTLYNYFTSKEELFRAYVERQCALSAETIFGGQTDCGDIAALLTDLGTRYLTRLTSVEMMRHLRTVIAEAGRNPEVGALFFASGPEQGRTRLAAIFERAAAEGRLDAPDPLRAADQFLALCQATLYKRRLFNVVEVPAPREIRADVEAAVATFMAAYRSDGRA